MPNRLRRSLLFMPGDDLRKIEKGAALNVDSVIMDLEDGVALNRKAEARDTIRRALREVEFGSAERLIRINPVSEEHTLWKADLDTTIEGYPDGYVIPKVESVEQIQQVDEYLTRAEGNYGWIFNSIRLIPIIESARGIINLNALAGCSDRLAALAFGAEDLAGDIGAIRTSDGWEIFYGRSALVIHAKAYGLQAIDTPYVNLSEDDSQLISETEQAHYMGYTGKLAIHPRQVTHIQRIFTPGPDAIIQARDLIAAHDRHQADGTGVFAYDGRMIDMPMIRAAQTVLNRAKAAGIDIETLEKGQTKA